MDVSSFIQENYVWIIIAAIVILMTVIGYIAEKTDFENSKKKNKKEKAKKEDNVVIPDSDDTAVNKVEPIVEENVKPEEVKETESEETADMYNFDDEDSMFNNMEMPEEPEVALEPVQETTIEQQNEETISNEENVQSFENIDGVTGSNENSESFEQVTEVSNQEDLINQETLGEVPVDDTYVNTEELDDNNLEIELPNIETLNEEIKDVIDEEDVWKF